MLEVRSSSCYGDCKQDMTLVSVTPDPDLFGHYRHLYAADDCTTCGGTGAVPDAVVDWRTALMRILDCFGGEEGVLYDSRWEDYGIDKGQRAAVLAAYNRHRKDMEGK
jgi:hypothetical protein